MKSLNKRYSTFVRIFGVLLIGILLVYKIYNKCRLSHSRTKTAVITSPSTGRADRHFLVSIKAGELENLLHKNELVLVEFYTTWCRYCTMMEPILKELAKAYRGKVVIGKLDIEKDPANARQYEITLFPSFILFKKGKLVEKMRGSQTKEYFQKLFREHLKEDRKTIKK